MRLIDADALLKSSGYNVRDCSIGAEYIISAPTVDAAPVVHGRWKYHKYVDKCECMRCGHFVRAGTDRNYCPNCGAKMDLPEKESTQ